MIIWLASYPKSGNTWLRAILHQIIIKKNNNHETWLSNLHKLVDTYLKDHTEYNKIKKAWDDHTIAIKKFGRYPHRNKILERISTEEENNFLKQPNSSW